MFHKPKVPSINLIKSLKSIQPIIYIYIERERERERERARCRWWWRGVGGV